MTAIEVLTFNCFGVAMDLKAVLRRRGPPDEHRMAHPVVRQCLERADVVCMQEVWIPEAVELFQGLEQEHKVHDANGWTFWPLTIAGSGLAIASRFPLASDGAGAFQCKGALSDKLARKGWLHAVPALGGDPARKLDVFTTHLQAGTGAACRRARSCQLGELREAVDALGTADGPVLLCGDMNIDGLRANQDDEYRQLMDLFSDFVDLGAEADQPTMCPDEEINELAHRYWSAEPNQRIDYLLYRCPPASWLRVESVTRLFDERLPAHGGPPTFASDHFGLAVRFELIDEERAASVPTGSNKGSSAD